MDAQILKQLEDKFERKVAVIERDLKLKDKQLKRILRSSNADGGYSSDHKSSKKSLHDRRSTMDATMPGALMPKLPFMKHGGRIADFGKGYAQLLKNSPQQMSPLPYHYSLVQHEYAQPNSRNMASVEQTAHSPDASRRGHSLNNSKQNRTRYLDPTTGQPLANSTMRSGEGTQHQFNNPGLAASPYNPQQMRQEFINMQLDYQNAQMTSPNVGEAKQMTHLKSPQHGIKRDQSKLSVAPSHKTMT